MTRAVYPHETTVESGIECAERFLRAAPLRPRFDGDFFDVGAFYGRRKGCQESLRQLQWEKAETIVDTTKLKRGVSKE